MSSNNHLILTPREIEVLSLYAQGLITKEIGSKLGISYHTVKVYCRRIFTIMKVHNMTHAVAEGIRRGLIT